ncbi:glycosyltransferase family 2 protein [Paracoccus jiaweipingae]|uniref:glycosyltransferase family 2 protein n=1 Tax=unclassified Paracoccus (in: a-proteobacteria) TaxID=2688777 RepID=UPI0037AE46EC
MGQATVPRASVVVVSRHRPGHLALCLESLAQQDHPDFEVILVADPASVLIRPDLPLRRIVFDIANISRARNIGLSRAAGRVVAFIDDDAVAEPTWLSRLAAALAGPGVLSAAGFTRGPDGICWQVRAERIGPDGQPRPLSVTGDAPQLHSANPLPVSTIGTNCAFRRAALVAIGGFDPDFRFHLDETDVNLRMATRFAQALTAVVPMAQVIHGLAPGTGRPVVRGAPDLAVIGRSHAILARKHRGSDGWVMAAQRRRLLREMLAGRLGPCAVAGAMRSLQAGLVAGRAVPLTAPDRAFGPPPGFRPLRGRFRGHTVLQGWLWQAPALRRQAAALVAQGIRVSVILLSPSVVPHRQRLTPGGWWERQGGLWGATARDAAATFRRAATFHALIAAEAVQLRGENGISDLPATALAQPHAIHEVYTKN